MRDYEGVKLVVLTSNGRNYDVLIQEDNTIATRATASQLASAIATEMGLDDDYDLYIKVPGNQRINSLNLSAVEAIVLLSSEARNIFVSGKRR